MCRLLLIIVFGCLCLTAADNFLDCPLGYSLCSCMKITGDDGTRRIQIECVVGNGTITIVKEFSASGIRFVRLDCGFQTDSYVKTNIPSLGVEDIYGLQIQHCRTTNPNVALIPVFQRLGVVRESLVRLEIGENGLVDLPDDLLMKLPQLKHLDLRSNRLQNLDQQTFRKLTNLTVLDLGDNFLTSIRPRMFNNFRNLRVLNLWNNSLTSLHAISFAGATNLEELDLSSNHLQSIAVDVFTGLRSLLTINLSGNMFENLPDNLLLRNSRLEHFRLNNNRSPLRLSNKLFYNLTNLKTIELTSSKCPHLPETIFAHNIKLQKLFLARNNISALRPQIFSNQRNLTYLDLSHNSLIKLDDNLLKRMTKLQVLKLSHNLINTITESSFLNLKNITEMHLDYNELTNIHTNTFNPIRKTAKILKLNNNQLPNIIARFHALNSLTHLDLAYNNIDTIYRSDLAQFSSSAPVLTVHLRNSNIHHIDFKSMNQTSSPRSTVLVNLESNPLQCDCDFVDFLQYLQVDGSIKNLKIETDGLQCATPRRMNNRKVSSLKPSELVCLDNAQAVQCPYPCNCSVNIDVVTVSCERSNLRKFPSVATGKGTKIVLQLAHDGITSLPMIKQQIAQGKLFELYVPSNNISSLNLTTLVGLQELQILDLSENQLEEFPEDVFRDTLNLQKLILTGNRFTKVESYTFTWLNNLRELRMDHNQLQHFKDEAILTFRQTMKTLILHHNRLTTISTTFRLLEQLEVLDLSHNRIQVLHSSDLQSISNANEVQFNLAGHQLAHLNFKYIERLILANPIIKPKILLNIQSNSVACGCEIYDYVRYASGGMNEKVYRMLTVRDKNLTCASPSALARRRVSALKLNQILCLADTTTLMPTESVTSRACECSKYKAICPQACCCCFAKYNGELRVNCSNADYSEFPDLTVDNEIKSIVLYMGHNNITELPNSAMENYDMVSEIQVDHNQITTFNISNLLPNLRTINLSYNQLQSIDTALVTQMKLSNLTSLSLAHNPWLCDCKLNDLRSLLAQDPTFSDYSAMRCVDQRVFSRAILCDDTWYESVRYPVVILVVLLILAIGCILFIKYQDEIKVWMFARNIFPGWVNEQSLDYNKKYDAFVSFSEEDLKYVKILMSTLESGPEPYKLCVHDRDWAPGEWVIEQIINSVEESRRTIILLSNNFLTSVWAKTEFRIAHQKAMEERRARVIIIIVDDLDENANLEPELKVYLSTNTYVKWQDTWFWEKLRYALNKPLAQQSYKKMLSKNLLWESERMYKIDGLDKYVK